MTVPLSQIEPFARGGNRVCYVHPDIPHCCVKVLRPDFTLQDRRRKKRFPGNLRSLASFDDNRQEASVVASLLRRHGESIHQHIYRCDGFVETDLGPGLLTELVRDADGRISVTLKQELWERGYPEATRRAVEALGAFWLEHLIPSRELLTHNIVVQKGVHGEIVRLVVIDGVGSPYLIPFERLPKLVQRHKVARRVRRLHKRIRKFIRHCDSGHQPSRVGMLMHRGSSYPCAVGFGAHLCVLPSHKD
jgi:hypothetical protein